MSRGGIRRIAAVLAGALVLTAVSGCEETKEKTKPDLLDGAVYKIVSADSGRVLGARDFGIVDGAYAELQAYEGDLNQVWRIHARENGSYGLECLSAGRFLSLKRENEKEGTPACVNHQKEDASVQNWIIQTASSGQVTLSSASSGLYLQAEGESKAAGTGIVQTQKKNGQAQKWELVQVDDGTRELPQMLQLTGSLEHSSTPEIQHFGNTYYLYAMQDGISLKTSSDMRQWVKQPNIVSTSRGYPFSWMKEVVPGRQVGGVWAPGVYKIGELYGLYYCFSVTGKQTSAIGLLTNTTLDPGDPAYKWVERGPVIISQNGDDFNAIDPNVITDGGQPWLAYGSYWSGIKLRRLNPETGLLLDNQVFSIASRTQTDKAIEAPYIVHREGYYYLFCAVEPMTKNYHVECGRAKEITGPYLDKNGVDMLQGGGTPVTEGKDGVRLPGHASEFQDTDGSWYLVTEYFQEGSNSLLGISTLVWDEEGWPQTALSPELFPKK